MSCGSSWLLCVMWQFVTIVCEYILPLLCAAIGECVAWKFVTIVWNSKIRDLSRAIWNMCINTFACGSTWTRLETVRDYCVWFKNSRLIARDIEHVYACGSSLMCIAVREFPDVYRSSWLIARDIEHVYSHVCVWQFPDVYRSSWLVRALSHTPLLRVAVREYVSWQFVHIACDIIHMYYQSCV